jgi:hypothetical protein
MSADEKVALDALEAVGVSGLSMFHLRCLAAFHQAACHLGWAKYGEYDSPRAHVEQRYRHDLQASTLDELHRRAQWDDAEWTARRHGARPTSP